MKSDKKVLYEILKKEYQENHQLFTILSGCHMGEQMLMKDGQMLWSSVRSSEAPKRSFWQGNEDSLSMIRGVEIKEIDGERIFCESFGGEESLVVCGAGHVSMPIIRIGKMLGFHVIVIDDREEFTKKARQEGADEIICKPFEEAIVGLKDSSNAYYVVVSRGHMYDQICLRSVFQKKYAYVGMMGSRKRVALVKEHLAELGIPQTVLDEVHTPIGLKIGAETPEEIAVSIFAEIIQVRRQGGQAEGFNLKLLEALVDEGQGKILATIISRKGSAPRRAGTKMIVYGDGSFVGTIGGGTLEYQILDYGRKMLQEDEAVTETELITVNLSNEQAGLEGMVCGGIVEVLLQRV